MGRPEPDRESSDQAPGITGAGKTCRGPRLAAARRGAVRGLANLHNQYRQRDVSGGVDIMGHAPPGAVTMTNNGNTQTAYRFADSFFQSLRTWASYREISPVNSPFFSTQAIAGCSSRRAILPSCSFRSLTCSRAEHRLSSGESAVSR